MGELSKGDDAFVKPALWMELAPTLAEPN